MMQRVVQTVIAVLILVAGVSCGGGDSPASAPSLDKDTERMLETSLQVASGLDITGIETGKDGITITYEQTVAEDRATMMRRWLDMAAVTLSFLDEPTTIIIRPTGSGATVSRVTIEAGDVAALLTGEMSFETAISRIKVQ